MLVVEQVIMHLPELSLSGCRLSRQSRVQRVGVNLDEREVAIDKTQPIAKLLSGKRCSSKRKSKCPCFC